MEFGTKTKIPEQLQKLVIEFLNEEATTLKDIFVEMECEKTDDYGQCLTAETANHFCHLTEAQKYSKLAAKIVAQLSDEDGSEPALLHVNFEHFLSGRPPIPAEQKDVLFKNLKIMAKHFTPIVVETLIQMAEGDELKQRQIISHISRCWWDPKCTNCPFKPPAEMSVFDNDLRIATPILKQ